MAQFRYAAGYPHNNRSRGQTGVVLGVYVHADDLQRITDKGAFDLLRTVVFVGGHVPRHDPVVVGNDFVMRDVGSSPYPCPGIS